MAKDQYDELMKRYLTNQVTEEERLRIDAWLDMLVDNNTRRLQLSDEEKEELYHKIISKREGIDTITSYRPESLRLLHRKKWTTRIAATLLILLVSGFVAYQALYKTGSDLGHAQYSANELKKTRLQDGTLIWSHEDAQVAYEQRQGQRHLDMKGEALFEVAKNPALPFVIQFEDVTVKVYGTSFSLKTGDQVELKVLTGKVSITSKTDTTGLIVTKGEQVIYTLKNGLQKMALSSDEAKRIVINTDYNMFFDNATLGTVIERMEKKFDVRFELENPHAAECHVKLDITDNSLEDSLKKIAAILHVEYKIDGSVIKLTGTGC